MSQLDTQKLELVFQSRPDILKGIREAADNPARVDLFNNIAAFILERLAGDDADQPVSKRRRVDIDQTNGKSNGHVKTDDVTGPVDLVAEAAEEELQLEIKDISISIPQRKKYNLCLSKHFIFARTNANPKPVAGMIWRWEDIEHVFFLPVPEKTQQQFNYVFLPRGTYLPTSNNPITTGAKPQASTPSSAGEPLLFTIPQAAPKPGSLAGKVAPQAQVAADSYSSLVNWAVPQFLRAAGTRLGLASPVEMVASDPKQFASAVRQSHRPSEKAVHVKAFRGSKDGYLFFLRTGILWGFKKPLVFLPLDRIVSVSYTSVLQRTFNMVVEVESIGDGATEELEFSMLDQEDYGGINQDYVHKYNLQDRSMAEQRKAKRELAEKAKKGGAGAAAGEDGEEGVAADGDTNMGELQRAQMEEEQRLQDEEDEEEEDYDPGSDGDSEGEGSSSDEEEGDGDGAEDEGDEDEDDDEEDL